MAQSAKLQLRQTHNLTLTPQLVQSLKLLQMNATELTLFVQGEVEKNPLLEVGDRQEEFPQERRTQLVEKVELGTSSDHQPRELDGEIKDWGEKNASERAENPQDNDFDAGITPKQSTNDLKQQSSSGEPISLSSSGSEYGSVNDLEAYVAQQQSLRDFLMQQAALSFRTEQDMIIAHDLIDMIDSDGYMRGELSSINRPSTVEMSDVERILDQIQHFDPPGVGARNLAECMRLQLREKDRLDPVMQIFTENLELLARRDYEKLAQLCGVDNEDLIDMAQEIKNLEPRPGDAFDPAPVQNIAPDVYVNAAPDGGWQIELNTQNLPRVLINREYYAEIKDLGLGKTDKKFMVDNLQNANWLVASLDQRARTILKVATEIVKQQDMFFVQGPEFLTPLTLRTVAEQVEMHESTISRVVSNKYLICERGIFEFKYFFMSGIQGKDGDAGFGAQSIQMKIKNMILSETKDTVLSDDKIAKILSEEGIDIARRTVAKYRESMGLLSSIQRRREKNIAKG